MLDKDKKKVIVAGIDKIVAETKSYDFPFWTHKNKKWQIINEKKSYIETQLKQLEPAVWPNDEKINQLWNESLTYADELFKTLPVKVKLNGFYLQELMFHYSTHLGEFILMSIEEK